MTPGLRADAFAHWLDIVALAADEASTATEKSLRADTDDPATLNLAVEGARSGASAQAKS